MTEKSNVSQEVANWRAEIDEIDSQIVTLVARRFAITEQVGVYKAEHGLPAFDPNRERTQDDRITQVAIDNGMNPDLIRGVFTRIREAVRNRHVEISQIRAKK